jgi:arsenite transporter
VLFLGADLADIVEFGPFLEAFIVLIVIPLALAWATQAWATRRPAGATFTRGASTAMVPLMVTTLLVVVASQVPKLGDDVSAVLGVIPFYILFLAVMAILGLATARLFRLGTRDSRAIVFTGATRNSLVVLPLALALPDTLSVAAIVIVTQTLVEVIGMVIYVRVIPRLIH